MKQTLKELRFAVIWAMLITATILLSLHVIEHSDMAGLSKMIVAILSICFIIFVYMAFLLLSLEIKRKYPPQNHFTLRFYEGNLFIAIPWIIFYWLKWQCLKAYIFLIYVKYEMKGKVYLSRGRYFSIEPIFCPDCLWCGFRKSAEHRYDTEECIKCGNEL